jgi:hypothetical protein
MMTKSEQRASDKLPVTAEAPSRLQPHRSPGDRKAKYRQIKVDIGFQQNGQESYTRWKGGRGVPPLASPTLTGHFHTTRDPDLNSTAVKVVASASGTASEVQLTVANRNYLHQLASSCTKLRNLHQKIFCQKNKSGRGLRALQAPSTLTPFSQFSSSKVGRHSLGSPLPSEPNLNGLPSLRFTRAARENTTRSRPITVLKNFLLKSVTPNPLRFAFDLTETNAIQRYPTVSNGIQRYPTVSNGI